LKVAILAGGLGTRLQEETTVRPKPMVLVGGRPLLWHILKIFSAAGLSEFVVALGYKGEIVKDYFLGYHQRASNLKVDLSTGRFETRDSDVEPWTVDLLDTGLETQTGGRVRRIARFIGPEAFCVTYGDGVADIDVRALLAFHRAHGRLATVTVVRPPARFGALRLSGDSVEAFEEKPQVGEGWINGGFFVLEPGVADYISGDADVFERGPLERLAREGQLMAYRHDGFWQCADTLRDLQQLEAAWRDGQAPWRIWR
jgi:glucose-1-phosphate cytidylyltransferase